MNLGPFTAALASALPAGARWVHVATLPAAAAVRAPTTLPAWLASRLRAQGISGLRPHQVQALQAARAGRHFVLAAPTASGKSLCYLLPVAVALAADPQATALYVSPAKALAQQQLERFRALAPDIPAALYDGDTPREERPHIREQVRVLYTNPDMLHVALLPYHTGWARCLSRLRFVVLDEVHQYTGAFGAHVVHVLRRLRRLAGLYGARPSFILLSATIGNPRELAEALAGEPVQLIEGSAAGLGPRTVAVCDAAAAGGARQVAVRLFAALVRAGHKTLLFGQSRQGVEALARAAHAQLPDQRRIAAYRSGYRPEERRRLEEALFRGEIDGMIATNALELGIDVGALDAVVLSAFPGSVASMWQQIGRAGRSGRPSLGVVILGESVLERHFAAHPQELLQRPVERAVVNPDNPFIAAQHADAMAWEAGDPVAAAPASPPEPHPRQRRPSPALELGIRATAARVRLLAGGAVIEETDRAHALLECFPGAIYLSGSRTFLCEAWEQHGIRLRELPEVPYYTRPEVSVELRLVSPAQGPWGSGRARVVTAVRGYLRLDPRTRQPLGRSPLEMPPLVTETDALWLAAPAEVQLPPGEMVAALHGAEHVLAGVMPTVVLSDPRDIQGVSYSSHPDLEGRAALFLYDDAPGGLGVCAAAADSLPRLLRIARETVASCPCVRGCPSCIQRAQCRSAHGLDKGATLSLLRAWVVISALRAGHGGGAQVRA